MWKIFNATDIWNVCFCQVKQGCWPDKLYNASLREDGDKGIEIAPYQPSKVLSCKQTSRILPKVFIWNICLLLWPKIFLDHLIDHSIFKPNPFWPFLCYPPTWPHYLISHKLIVSVSVEKWKSYKGVGNIWPPGSITKLWKKDEIRHYQLIWCPVSLAALALLIFPNFIDSFDFPLSVIFRSWKSWILI